MFKFKNQIISVKDNINHIINKSVLNNKIYCIKDFIFIFNSFKVCQFNNFKFSQKKKYIVKKNNLLGIIRKKGDVERFLLNFIRKCLLFLNYKIFLKNITDIYILFFIEFLRNFYIIFNLNINKFNLQFRLNSKMFLSTIITDFYKNFLNISVKNSYNLFLLDIGEKINKDELFFKKFLKNFYFKLFITKKNGEKLIFKSDDLNKRVKLNFINLKYKLFFQTIYKKISINSKYYNNLLYNFISIWNNILFIASLKVLFKSNIHSFNCIIPFQKNKFIFFKRNKLFLVNIKLGIYFFKFKLKISEQKKIILKLYRINNWIGSFSGNSKKNIFKIWAFNCEKKFQYQLINYYSVFYYSLKYKIFFNTYNRKYSYPIYRVIRNYLSITETGNIILLSLKTNNLNLYYELINNLFSNFNYRFNFGFINYLFCNYFKNLEKNLIFQVIVFIIKFLVLRRVNLEFVSLNNKLNYFKYLFNNLIYIYFVKYRNTFLKNLKYNYLNQLFIKKISKILLRFDTKSLFFNYILYLVNNKIFVSGIQKKKVFSLKSYLSIKKFSRVNQFVSCNYYILNEISGLKKNFFLKKQFNLFIINNISFLYKSRIIYLFYTFFLKKGIKYKSEQIIQKMLNNLFLLTNGKNPLLVLLKIFSILLNVFNNKRIKKGFREVILLDYYNTEEQIKFIIKNISLLISNVKKSHFYVNEFDFIWKKFSRLDERLIKFIIYILYNSSLFIKKNQEFIKLSYKNLKFNINSVLKEDLVSNKKINKKSNLKLDFLLNNFKNSIYITRIFKIAAKKDYYVNYKRLKLYKKLFIKCFQTLKINFRSKNKINDLIKSILFEVAKLEFNFVEVKKKDFFKKKKIKEVNYFKLFKKNKFLKKKKKNHIRWFYFSSTIVKVFYNIIRSKVFDKDIIDILLKGLFKFNSGLKIVLFLGIKKTKKFKDTYISKRLGKGRLDSRDLFKSSHNFIKIKKNICTNNEKKKRMLKVKYILNKSLVTNGKVLSSIRKKNYSYLIYFFNLVVNIYLLLKKKDKKIKFQFNINELDIGILCTFYTIFLKYLNFYIKYKKLGRFSDQSKINYIKEYFFSILTNNKDDKKIIRGSITKGNLFSNDLVFLVNLKNNYFIRKYSNRFNNGIIKVKKNKNFLNYIPKYLFQFLNYRYNNIKI